MSASAGRFITLEGTEGVGKSTNLAFIRDYLARQGIDVRLTREPGGTPLAEAIRDLLLDKHEEEVCGLTELLLVFAARAQHLARVVQPALDRGQWVLSDRFTDATYAYQGAGRGLSTTVIGELENLVQGDLRPHLTIILDIDIEAGLVRAAQRGEPDRFESESIAFFGRVRAGYHRLAEANPQRYAVVDAGASLEQVQAEIARILDQFIANTRG